jgi:hypothetical protein
MALISTLVLNEELSIQIKGRIVTKLKISRITVRVVEFIFFFNGFILSRNTVLSGNLERKGG